MKHLKLTIFCYMALLSIVACNSQHDSEERIIKATLKEFYTAHANIWSIPPSDISPEMFDKKLDSLAGIYLTQNLRTEAGKWVEKGYDFMTNDFGIYSESEKSMTIERDYKKDGVYIVSYSLVHKSRVSGGSGKEQHVRLYVKVVREGYSYKINSVDGVIADNQSVIENEISNDSDELIAADESSNNVNQLEGETISGWLKLGLSEKKILDELGYGGIFGEQEYSQVDGEYYQSWDFKEKGINLVMRSDTLESEKFIAEIKLTYPCNMITSHGIGIGSSQEEVYNQYKGNISKENSNQEIVTVGNIYEGVFFMLKESKVTEIIIGSMAE